MDLLAGVHKAGEESESTHQLTGLDIQREKVQAWHGPEKLFCLLSVYQEPLRETN